MHVVVRKYTASPDVIAETRRHMEHLEETMRSVPGFAAYYFIETDDGLATITVTDDEAGTAESMGMAALDRGAHAEPLARNAGGHRGTSADQRHPVA